MELGETVMVRFLTVVFLLFAGISNAAAEVAHLIPESVRPCDAPCARLAVVFIHGFTGARTTWLNDTTKFYWPAGMAADPQMGDQLDIYRIDFDSYYQSGATFDDIGKDVALALDPLMSRRQYNKVVLIGHSLG